jgi:hypothetical protein
MLIFVQLFGLSSPGGGPRIFRALLQDAEMSFLSICTSPKRPPSTTIGPELHVPIRPYFGRLESTRFAHYLQGLEGLLADRFQDQLLVACSRYQATGIHGLAHTFDFWYAYRVSQKLGLPYYLSVHDDLAYAMQGHSQCDQALSRIAEVWSAAKARFVISEAMGEEYCRRYGTQPFTVVTDGLVEFPPVPLQRPEKSLRVYFMGALHLSYAANFHALLKALAMFKRAHPDWVVSMTIRGGVAFPLSEPDVPIIILPWAPEVEVAQDITNADVLYFPLPFGDAYEGFVQYSLSTKMVTYLGSGLPILYHGPQVAAANQMLVKNTAAFVASALEPESIYKTLLEIHEQRQVVVKNALELGQRSFALPEIRTQFWQALQG